VLALAIGAFALRPQRRDFQATVMLVVSIIAATLVVTEQGWFNGGQGLFGIPQPFVASLNLTITGLPVGLRRDHRPDRPADAVRV